MGKDKPKGAVSHTLEIPQFDANQYWLKTAFDIISKMTDVASSMESYNDIKYNTLTEMLIETVLNEDLKAVMFDKRDQEIKALEDRELSTEDMNKALWRTNIKLFGQWFQHAKKYMTLEEKLEIFRTAPDVG